MLVPPAGGLAPPPRGESWIRPYIGQWGIYVYFCPVKIVADKDMDAEICRPLLPRFCLLVLEDPKGAARERKKCPPRSNFFHFHPVLGKNSCQKLGFCPKPRCWRLPRIPPPPSGKSWILHCLAQILLHFVIMMTKHWRIQGGRQGRSLGGVQFFHFHVVFGKKICKIIALMGVGAPPSGKSWIRHCKGHGCERSGKFCILHPINFPKITKIISSWSWIQLTYNCWSKPHKNRPQLLKTIYWKIV